MHIGPCHKQAPQKYPPDDAPASNIPSSIFPSKSEFLREKPAGTNQSAKGDGLAKTAGMAPCKVEKVKGKGNKSGAAGEPGSGGKNSAPRSPDGERGAQTENKRKSRRRPPFPPVGSIIGAGALDFRVRNGNGYFRPAMAAGIQKAFQKKEEEGDDPRHDAAGERIWPGLTAY